MLSKFRAWVHNTLMVDVESINFFDGEIGWVGYDFANGESVWTYAPFKDVKLMQFVGFYDKNREEIYEGDILKVKYHTGNHVMGVNEHYFVEWNNECTHIVGDFHKDWSIIGYYLRYGEAEVIGNIHEHPHLLDRKEK